MEKILPHLGRGFIREPGAQLAILIAHALASDKSQSNLYPNDITSIAYVISKYERTPSALVTELTKVLDKYLSRYFVNPTIVINIIDELATGSYTITLEISVMVGTEIFNLSNKLVVENGVLARTITGVNA